jgi:hypothetical protein
MPSNVQKVAWSLGFTVLALAMIGVGEWCGAVCSMQIS